MTVRDFKKFFKRRGRFMRQLQNDNKTFQRSRDDKNGKSDRKCFRCGDPNHLIGECPKPPKDKNQRAFFGGSWSDSGEEDDEKVNNKTCLVAQASSEVCSESSYFSDENSSIDDLVLHNEYDKLLDIVNDNIASAFMSTSKLNDSILWHAKLGHCKTCMRNKITKKPFQNVKRETEVLEPIYSNLCDLHATPSLENKKYFVTFIDDASRFCYVSLLHSKDEALNKFKVFKTEVELQQLPQIKIFRTDREGLSQGFWGEPMLTTCYLLNWVPNKRNMITPYELWTKRKPNLNYLRVWGCRAVVRLHDPKLKTLGERGIECIFVGYAEHSKAFRFYVIEPNDSVSINSIIESRDAIFDENRFSSVPRPSLRIPNGTEDIGGLVVPEEVTEEVVQQPEPELRKSKRNRTPKDFGPEFQLYLIEGTRDEDVAFWKEAINDEMDSIMGNNTWVLVDLPPGCKPLGCKWIFKRKLKVDETIEKLKARLVIQGFKQKSRIYYFDTYALVARISTIRLLIAIASIHNLIIHQMDVKTTFLNGDLEDEVYMNQPQGFIVPSNENKVCKLIKSLYGLKQAPKQWHQKFDEVVLSNGYLLNQANKCVYRKFDESSKGVIIYLYVDDMLIFGIDQVQVDLTKEFLASKFSIKDMGEANVILGIRIKHESNGIAISQSHYIEKVLNKFNYFDCTPVSTPMDTSEKLMPNNGHDVSQLEYSRVIGCLMYDMTCTRLDIAFVVGKLSRYTSNPGTQHWQAIQRAFKKQTCITGSIMESEFVVLAAAGKEAECVATLAKAYSQMYNGKSRHLSVRHSMIRELITNGVVSIEFMRSQQNLADHLTK
ncbi:zinc finger, CCHC-type containing protein [Tanacetum coccineum]|uniref:Zinc finger, CCHC-type containing protein n=1 Tax=Tanacetum coccineum TaxID=301880 RepID=A0ABQ5EQG3_9ASTR